jgi:hypothetical protein
MARDNQGSMFWSQFSAIFANFRRKMGVFLKKQCYDQDFEYFSFVLSQKRQLFRWIFRRKYLKNHNIDPRHGSYSMPGVSPPSRGRRQIAFAGEIILRVPISALHHGDERVKHIQSGPGPEPGPATAAALRGQTSIKNFD